MAALAASFKLFVTVSYNQRKQHSRFLSSSPYSLLRQETFLFFMNNFLSIYLPMNNFLFIYLPIHVAMGVRGVSDYLQKTGKKQISKHSNMLYCYHLLNNHYLQYVQSHEKVSFHHTSKNLMNFHAKIRQRF